MSNHSQSGYTGGLSRPPVIPPIVLKNNAVNGNIIMGADRPAAPYSTSGISEGFSTAKSLRASYDYVKPSSATSAGGSPSPSKENSNRPSAAGAGGSGDGDRESVFSSFFEGANATRTGGKPSGSSRDSSSTPFGAGKKGGWYAGKGGMYWTGKGNRGGKGVNTNGTSNGSAGQTPQNLARRWADSTRRLESIRKQMAELSAREEDERTILRRVSDDYDRLFFDGHL
eukprot:gene163-389_t